MTYIRIRYNKEVKEHPMEKEHTFIEKTKSLLNKEKSLLVEVHRPPREYTQLDWYSRHLYHI